MEPWRRVWREGLSPLLSDRGLEALEEALETDSSRLIQGATTVPPPLQCVSDWPVEAACLTAYAGWRGDGLETVAEVEEFFARICGEADERVGEPAGCRHVLNFWDDTPREEAVAKMLPEVRRSLWQRRALEGGKGVYKLYHFKSDLPPDLLASVMMGRTEPTFPEDHEEVALVASDSVEEVFGLSQNLDGAWRGSPEVLPLKEGGLRSTCVGDVVENGASGKRFRCGALTWFEMPAGESGGSDPDGLLEGARKNMVKIIRELD